MPKYDSIEFTQHARERMQERHITEEDVIHILQFGNGRSGKRGMWLFDMYSATKIGVRVVVKEFGDTARVITVIRLRKRS